MSSSKVMIISFGNSFRVGISFLYERVSVVHFIVRPYGIKSNKVLGKSFSLLGNCSSASHKITLSAGKLCFNNVIIVL